MNTTIRKAIRASCIAAFLMYGATALANASS
jgi:hypothetical protein